MGFVGVPNMMEHTRCVFIFNLKAEQYLVQVLKQGTSIKVMDELRY